MSDGPLLSLVVIRVSDIDKSAEFYAAMGLVFKREQHPSGPEHYSATCGGIVFELYPASEVFPLTPSRFGFAVASLDAVLSELRQKGCDVISEPKESPGGIRAVIADPDGHRIELTQRPAPDSN